MITKKSQALRMARALIEQGSSNHICMALHRLRFANAIDYETEAFLRHEVMKRLEGRSTVEAWLCANVSGFKAWLDECCESDRSDDIFEQTRPYRLRWLDALIAEFEAEGE